MERAVLALASVAGRIPFACAAADIRPALERRSSPVAWAGALSGLDPGWAVRRRSYRPMGSWHRREQLTVVGVDPINLICEKRADL
jgi:hypothetical protein